MSRRALLASLLLLALLGLTWNWWQSDRRRIDRQIGRLQDAVSKSGPESPLQGVARAREVTTVFATHFEIRADQLDFRTRDRQQLVGFVHQYRSSSDSIRMSVSQRDLDIAPEHGRATLTATFEFPSGGPLGRASEAYRVQVNWLEENGTWVIDYVALLEILDRTGR